MRDPRLDRLADVVVRYSARVKAGDLVTIVADPAVMPAVEAVFEATLRAGGHPSFHPRSLRLREVMLQHASDEQLRHVSPFERFRLQTCDVLIVLAYEMESAVIARAPAARLAAAEASRRELMPMSMQRSADGLMRYVLTEVPGPTAATAAGMSPVEYEDWVYRANLLHEPDPVAAWQALHAKQARVVEYLTGKRTLRFRSPPGDGVGGTRRHDGTDLTVDVTGRTWINCAGAENMPDGEVFSGPCGAEGVVNLSFPAVYRGRSAEGIRLVFKGGRVVEASAAVGEEFLFEMLNQDAGAGVMGEIALGTNYALARFVCNTLFDEKIGGTFHFALGAGIPESGNTNVSALHWDMVHDLRPRGGMGGTVHVDGELIQRDGKFVFAGWPGV